MKVAVIAVLNDLGASKKLSAIIGGESVLNDGSAIVLVSLFMSLQSGEDIGGMDALLFAFRECFGAVAFGTVFGMLQCFCFHVLGDQPTALVAVSFTMPYLCFLIASTYLHTSGVLSLVPFGILANVIGRAYIVGSVAERMEHFWEQIEFIANTLLFAISGLLIASDLKAGTIMASDWLALLALYILLLVVRGVTILILYPLLSCYGYGMSKNECIMTWWGGMRGAVGLTLALSLRSSDSVGEIVGNLATFFMGGIVVINSIVHATTAGSLLKYLELENLPDKEILKEIRTQFVDIAVDTVKFAGCNHEEIQKVLHEDEGWIEKHVDEIINPVASLIRSHSTIQYSHIHSSAEVMMEKRRHFLLSQNSTYDYLLSRGVIPRSAWMVLVKSVDRALDSRESEIDQWRQVVGCTETQMAMSIIRWMGSEDEMAVVHACYGRIEQSDSYYDPSNNFIVSYCVQFIAYLAYGYLRAHEMGRLSLKALHSRKDNLMHLREKLDKESINDCEQAAMVLNVVRSHCPIVLCRIKTSQLATAIKWQLFDKAFSLLELGLIEHNELEPILESADEISTRCNQLHLRLHMGGRVSSEGDMEANRDLYPFMDCKIPENRKMSSSFEEELGYQTFARDEARVTVDFEQVEKLYSRRNSRASMDPSLLPRSNRRGSYLS